MKLRNAKFSALILAATVWVPTLPVRKLSRPTRQPCGGIFIFAEGEGEGGLFFEEHEEGVRLFVGGKGALAMQIDYVGLFLHAILLGVCTTTYWKAGAMEDRAGQGPSVLWAGLSALMFLVMWLVLGWGWPTIIGGQVLLGVGIGVVRVFVLKEDGEK